MSKVELYAIVGIQRGDGSLFAHMERAAHARAVATAKGKRAGRPRKLSPSQIAAARAAVVAGLHVDQVADVLGVRRATLYRHVSRGDVS